MGENYQNITTSEKIRDWVARRFHIVIGASAISLVASAITLIYVSNSKEKQLQAWQKIAEEMSSKVVVATVDGRVALVEKQPLQYEIAKAVVNQFVRDTFLFDIQHLFGGINPKNKPVNFKDFLNKSPLVKKIIEMKCYTKNGVKYFLSIFKYYYGFYQGQQLIRIPLTIYLKQPENERFEYKKDGSFTYRATWDVEFTYISPPDKIERGEGTMEIEMRGFFKPFEGNPFNPLGIKIDYIKIRPVLSPVQG